MSPTKTVDVRENELQALLATAVGRAQLRDLKKQYETEAGRLSPVGKSVLSFILAHEKRKGLLAR